jgi:hypothetical protein
MEVRPKVDNREKDPKPKFNENAAFHRNNSRMLNDITSNNHPAKKPSLNNHEIKFCVSSHCQINVQVMLTIDSTNYFFKNR